MNFSAQTYTVVPVNQLLENLAANQFPAGVTANDLMDTISASNSVSFGDAIDTILSTKTVCDILGCDVPDGVDPYMLVGLGS